MYTSPAQITQVNVDKKVKTTQRSEYYFGHQEAVIGDQYDSYHQDGYGNVNTMTDATYGDFITNHLYNEYGRSVTPLENTYGYRSQIHDDASTINLRARIYQTRSGRFLQEDSYYGEVEEWASQNRYTYVGNNPLNYRDDSGNIRLPKIVQKAANLAKKLIPKPIAAVVNAAYKGVKTIYNAYQASKPKKLPVLIQSKMNASKVANWATGFVKTVAQAVAYLNPLQLKKMQAQATRKKAEARKKVICTTNSKEWKGSKEISLPILMPRPLMAIPYPTPPIIPYYPSNPGIGDLQLPDIDLPKIKETLDEWTKNLYPDWYKQVEGAGKILIGEAIKGALKSAIEDSDKSTSQNDNRTAEEIISQEKKGAINREFPKEWLDATIGEIEKAAKRGEEGARKAKKLLQDKRFNKDDNRK